MAKVKAVATAVRTGLQLIRSNPLTLAAVVGGVATYAYLSGPQGIYAQPIVLSGKTFYLSESAVDDVGKALEANDRDALMKAVPELLVLNPDEKVSDLDTSFAPIAAPLESDNFLPGMIAGALVVVGESRSGKTTFIRTLKADLQIRISEPLEQDDNAENTVVLSNYAHAIGLALAATIHGRRVTVDSLRGLMYRLQGNTLEGGVSAGLFELLTTLNNLAASVGSTIVFSVNPMTGDEAKLATLLRRIEASVAGFIYMKGGRQEAVAYRTFDGRRLSSENGSARLESEGQSFTATPEPGEGGIGYLRPSASLGGDKGSVVDQTLHTVISTRPDKSDPKAQTFPVLKFD